MIPESPLGLALGGKAVEREREGERIQKTCFAFIRKRVFKFVDIGGGNR